MALLYGLLVLLGFAIGSFLNVCIYRLPIKESVVFPPSHCIICKKRLKPIDLVPVFSYISIKGRCRYCGSKVSLRYPIVEVLTAFLFILCFNVIGLSEELIKALTLTSFIIVITYIDYDHQLILDKVLIWLAGVGVVINLSLGSVSITDMLIAGLTGGGTMLIIALISRGGMGGGDIKFVAALGLWLGLKLTLLTLFLSFVLGGLGGAIVLLLKLKNRKDLIPFGPFIALGAFISMLYGNEIIIWYVKSFMR